ncbi:MAG TPA: phosphate ABC transporter substrate-binding protein [Geomobilimonas sp.]|nr:phosphate ABC transporter substrate-binding protein [Geomobilimonas sp.]
MTAGTIFFSAPAARAAGNIDYSGSISIGIGILQAGASHAFEKKTGIKFTSIDTSGSGKGIKALLRGKASLAGLTRPIAPAEKARNLVAVTIGYDTLGIFVHQNNPVKNLSTAQLKGIFTGRITNWREVGGDNTPIAATIEDPTGGRAAVEMFRKIVMGGASYAKGLKQIESPLDQLKQTARTENGICVVNLGIFPSLDPSVGKKLKIVMMNDYAPTPDNIVSGRYPISIPLQLVRESPPRNEERRFISFMLSDEGQAIVGRHFLPLQKGP